MAKTIRTSTTLEDLFDMGSPSDYEPKNEETSKKEIQEIQAVMANVDKIDAALPLIKGLEVHEDEMDDLAEKATESFENISNLAMNQEARFGARMFEVAGQMLGHAITAKTAKIDKKLKAIELQIKKLKIDNDKGDDSEVIDGDGIIINRNDLLSKILDQKE